MTENSAELIRKHAQSLEFDKVLENLANFAVSQAGKQKCLSAPVYVKKYQIEEQP